LPKLTLVVTSIFTLTSSPKKLVFFIFSSISLLFLDLINVAKNYCAVEKISFVDKTKKINSTINDYLKHDSIELGTKPNSSRLNSYSTDAAGL
jgi:hypothetical protein